VIALDVWGIFLEFPKISGDFRGFPMTLSIDHPQRVFVWV
jgi:hypothetical protein